MANKSSQKIATDSLNKLGWLVGRTESYSGYTGQCADLWGFLDAVGVTPYRMVGLQFCGEDYQPHIQKIEPLINAITVNNVTDTYLIGVKKMKIKRGAKQERWCFRVGIFESTSSSKLTYKELVSWTDRNFDLSFLVDMEKTLYRDKTMEIIKNGKR